jgi:hypothetical protein
MGRFEFWPLFPNFFRLRHPERSRFSGEARDLALSDNGMIRARSLRPLVKTRAFGMTHPRKKFKLTHYRSEPVRPRYRLLFEREVQGFGFAGAYRNLPGLSPQLLLPRCDRIVARRQTLQVEVAVLVRDRKIWMF